MVRAPCCEKMGLKRGPWTLEEDQILIDYIRVHGHGNWRKLPKLAGLLRCGKSCRLRWTNYLRPDIKRGNFSKEEENTIIMLHGMLGNRWSAIAARLPGRTDNEIKNIWHTHLKKRLPKHETDVTSEDKTVDGEFKPVPTPDNTQQEETYDSGLSPQHCSSSSISSAVISDDGNNASQATGYSEDNFWSEVLSINDDCGGLKVGIQDINDFLLWEGTDDYWYNILSSAALPELLEI
ncbi:transcription factor MYB13 [Punica granatum]|uniref:Transcription factor MYB13 n=1 Tax=Punica granatum TaxID=22663 RepID=A0A218WN28_PUNGR|nr:transcription factor MYB13 [Punica granatum]OWM73889.1 hypothetical protein CDL15_Pgr018949 [Punica granatum]